MSPRRRTTHHLVRGSGPLRLTMAAASVLLLACSAGPMPVSTSADDPSNPSAPAGTDPRLAAPTASTDESAHHHHAGHEHAGDASNEVAYVCPHHPEVTSTKPGDVCPKCNMKLVPKQK